MQKELTDFRISDSDLCAYLMTKGYEPISIEVKEDKRHANRLKAFTHFLGSKEDFITLQNDYENNKVHINLKEFSIARQKINKLIKNELDCYAKLK